MVDSLILAVLQELGCRMGTERMNGKSALSTYSKETELPAFPTNDKNQHDPWSPLHTLHGSLGLSHALC